MDTPDDDAPDTVATLLRTDRAALGITIRDHAALIGVSLPTYYRLQQDQLGPVTRAVARFLLTRCQR